MVVSRGNHVGFLKRRCFTTTLKADKRGGDSLPPLYLHVICGWPASSRRKPHARAQWRAASWRWRIRPGRVLRPAGRIRCNAAASRRRARAGRCRACDDAAAAGRAVLRAARRTPCSAAAKRRLWRAGQRGPARHQCQNYAPGPGTVLACQSRTTRLKPACACDTDHARARNSRLLVRATRITPVKSANLLVHATLITPVQPPCNTDH